MLDRYEVILKEIEKEFLEAEQKFGPFSSHHEGYAVLLEEVDELWEEVKKKKSVRDTDNMRKECIQVAAMALRFYYDLL
jgi:NTP pyrophosphatase (non-canonical NTP hydrolase)